MRWSQKGENHLKLFTAQASCRHGIPASSLTIRPSVTSDPDDLRILSSPSKMTRRSPVLQPLPGTLSKTQWPCWWPRTGHARGCSCGMWDVGLFLVQVLIVKSCCFVLVRPPDKLQSDHVFCVKVPAFKEGTSSWLAFWFAKFKVPKAVSTWTVADVCVDSRQ